LEEWKLKRIEQHHIENLDLNLTKLNKLLRKNAFTSTDNDVIDEKKMWIGAVGYTFYIKYFSPIEDMRKVLFDLKEHLKQFAAVSNKTEIGTATAEKLAKDDISEDAYNELMRGVCRQSPTKPQNDLDEFLESDQVIDKWWTNKEPTKELVEFCLTSPKSLLLQRLTSRG
jgi:hypothetical protein